MTLEVHRAHVEQTVKTFMAANYPTVPIMCENAKFAWPDETWIAVWVMTGNGFRAKRGADHVMRYAGIVQIDVLVPEDLGTNDAYIIAESLAKLFQETEVQLPDGDRVLYRFPRYASFPGQRGFYRRIVDFEFVRDEQID